MGYVAGPRPIKLTAENVTAIRNRYRRYDPLNGGAALARSLGIKPEEGWQHIPDFTLHPDPLGELKP